MRRLNKATREGIDVGQCQHLLEAILLWTISQRSATRSLLVVARRAGIGHCEGRGEGAWNGIRIRTIGTAIRHEQQRNKPDRSETSLAIVVVKVVVERQILRLRLWRHIRVVLLALHEIARTGAGIGNVG